MKNASQYSLSISDLIMGLLFIFILILMKFMLEYENKKTELLFPIEERKKIINKIGKEIEKKNIQVEIDEKNGVLKLKNLHYFNKGSYKLSSKGEKDFKQIKKIFHRLICYSDLKNPRTKKKWQSTKYGKDNFSKWVKYCDKNHRNKYNLIDSIFIEGHADWTPIGKSLKLKGVETNIDLAMRRSQTVFKFLTNYKEAAIKADESYLYFLSNEQGNPLFGVASYGNLRSKQSLSHDPSSEAKDRRIDIRFIMTQPKGLKEELKNIN